LKSKLFKILVALLVVAGLLTLFHFLPLEVWIKQLLSYVRGLGAWGYVLFILAYVACCVFLVPAFTLTVGAGAIYGFAIGSALVITGASLGAAAAFFLARTILRARVQKMAEGNRKFAALDRAIAEKGARIVFLVRLSPLFPFTWLNYAFGLTGIRPIPYLVATFFGIIPGTLAFVWATATATAAATGSATTTKLALNIAGAVIAVAVAILVARIATSAIRKAGVDA
jgi:uncharacterized membrane protein YdjX (TVP38/TMEM64 family)